MVSSAAVLDTYASLLASSINIKRFSYTQHLDIMRGLSEGVKDVIYAYYTNIHQNNLSIIIPEIGEENLLDQLYRSLWDEDDIVLHCTQAFRIFFSGSDRHHLSACSILDNFIQPNYPDPGSTEGHPG